MEIKIKEIFFNGGIIYLDECGLVNIHECSGKLGELIHNQKKLPDDMNKVLHDNLNDLYEA
jgi:hypothetical protein